MLFRSIVALLDRGGRQLTERTGRVPLVIARLNSSEPASRRREPWDSLRRGLLGPPRAPFNLTPPTLYSLYLPELLLRPTAADFEVPIPNALLRESLRLALGATC